MTSKCKCGCGGVVTRLYKRTNTACGHVAGMPVRFIAGHQFLEATRQRWRRYTERKVSSLGQTKTCSKCGDNKSVDEFYVAKAGLHRRQGWCKKCARQQTEKYYADNPSVKSSYNRKGYAKAKDIVFDHYGWRCACCGETEPLFLTIDHVNNDGGGRYRTTTGRALYVSIIQSGFSSEYQVLCWNCNTGRHRNGGVCPHTISTSRVPYRLRVQ
jgi:hypothetical protein